MFKHEFLPVHELSEEMREDGRYYTTPEGVFASVTTILSKMHEDDGGIERWKKRVGEKEADTILRKAGRRGSSLHKNAENYILNKEVVYKTPLNRFLFEQIKPSLDNINKVYGVELPLYSKRLRTAGRTDLIAEYEGIVSIIDYKTAIRAKREEWIQDYFLQSATYSMMAFERYGLKVPQIIILMATEDGDPQTFKKPTNLYISKVLETFRKYQSQINIDEEI